MVELAGIIILGILAQWIGWKIKIPAILPLILTGFLFGPLSTLWTDDGTKLIEPIFNEASGKGIFPGESLFYFVSLAIGVILFEGGLGLKRKEINIVGPAILKLVTLGALVTFIGAGVAAHFLVGLSWPISFLFSALIIVTGPTVIAPILQNIPLSTNVSTVLRWEGILIDPIGALIAVLVFEFIHSSSGAADITSHTIIPFFQIIVTGLAIGAVAAIALYQLIRYKLVPHYLLNVFTLALVLTAFVFSDFIAKESGLLTVVVMGMVLGNLEVPRLEEILSFKESLSILLISILFILLAANIDMKDILLLLNDWRTLLLFAFVALVLRPVSVLLSTRKTDLALREKLFISWVGPRGIVAAGIASLFGIKLTQDGFPGAEYITPLVFMIVLGTVLLNATTARLVARMLGVILEKSDGILLIGSNSISRLIANYLQNNQRHVVLVDNNENSINKAKSIGLDAFKANIYEDDLSDHIELLDMGYLIAMTSSADVNAYAVEKFEEEFGENGTFRLISAEELKKGKAYLPNQGILSYTDDYINLSEIVRDCPEIHERILKSQEDFIAVMDHFKQTEQSTPILIKRVTGEISIIPKKIDHIEILENETLIYLGKEIATS